MSEVHSSGIDPFSELKRSYEDYKVFDAHFENMGKVHDIFVDERDRVRYISIGSGLLNMDFIPIPIEVVRLNDKRQLIEVDAPKAQTMHAPTFSDSSDLTRENEDSVRRHFGLLSSGTPSVHESQSGIADGPSVPGEDSRVDLTPGEREEVVSEPSHRTLDHSDQPDRRRSDSTPSRESALNESEKTVRRFAR